MTGNIWRQLVILALLIAAMNYLYFAASPPQQEPVATISYSRFKGELEKGNIAAVTVQAQTLSGSFRKPLELPGALEKGQPKPPQPAKSYQKFTTTLPPFQDPGLMKSIEGQGVDLVAKVEVSPSVWTTVLVSLLPWVLILGLWWFLFRRMRNRGGPGGMLGTFAKSGAKLYSRENSQVTFEDVAGLEEAKQELREIVDFLKDPKKFARIGGKVPRGVLLVGPPGTGKTLMARAVAGEAGVPFFSISASQFIEMFVGVGASRVRDLFDNAKKNAPSIIFIDELDAVGRSRGTGLGGGNDEREQTLNQLLSELDGFDPHSEVIVMSATNRPDVLDTALLRPGRFDRQVVVERPDWRAREAILKVHTRKVPLAKNVDMQVLARGTPGMCGADLESLINEAALIAARDDLQEVGMDQLERAKDRMLMGAERKLFLNEEERRVTAIHEAGHTLVARLTPGSDPIHKVTIIPRGQALGVTQQLPEDDRYHYRRSYLLARVAVALGGRAAEQAIFGEVSTGAQNDLQQVSDLVEKMVCQWGMSERIGPQSFSRGAEHPFLGRKLAVDKTFSEQTAWLIDQEIEKIVKQEEARANALVAGHRPALEALAAALLEEEVLDRERVDRILTRAGVEPASTSQSGQVTREGGEEE
jgi:cell division protease FtsH